jgi:two-component system nitrogen regulation response regulator GlnG
MNNNPKILICDDEEGIRESLSLILKEKYNLIMTCSGLDCLKKLKSEKDINLVLMDIKMPKHNGLEITKEIKRLYPNIKVIIVTGYKSAEIAQEATSVGADDYIVKPFESKEILKKAQAYL